MALLLSTANFANDLVETSLQQKSSYNEDRSEIHRWCKNKLRFLNRFKREATMHYSYGQQEKALQVLTDGLIQASSQLDPYFSGALTSIAITRGVEYINALHLQAQGNRLQVKTMAYFLFEYYEFITYVANNLDMPYYTPGNCRFCRMGKHKKFEKKFVVFAKKQLEMVLKTMTEVDYERGHQSVVYPIGNPASVLIALELATGFMKNDLESSLYSRRFACTILDLQDLNTSLYRYNSTGTGFPSQYLALQFTAQDAMAITNSNFRCHNDDYRRGHDDRYDDRYDRPRLPQSSTTNILKHSFKLKSGRTKSIQLRSHQYIKKLIIEAEGIRRDATFEVIVNGEVKGTIYVPGRDPSYIVTIEDSTSSIEFMSRNGNARIRKIFVVRENEHHQY